MKKISMQLIIFLGKLWSYLYSFNTSKKISAVKTIFYTAWLSREFKSFGKSSMIYSNIYLLGGKYIMIGDKCSIGKSTVLFAWDQHGLDTFTPQITIGNNVSIGSESHITAINKIEIGNNVLTGKKITIADNAHGKSELLFMSIPPSERPLYSEGPIIIEDNVWIGDKVTILSNVRIGKNSIIGANAVVTKDIPSNCIAGGIPARIIKILE